MLGEFSKVELPSEQFVQASLRNLAMLGLHMSAVDPKDRMILLSLFFSSLSPLYRSSQRWMDRALAGD